MSYPPISQVFARNACLDVLDQLRTYLRSKNEHGIKHIGNMLSDLGLDHIAAAFIKCVEEDLICHLCGKQVKLIDELCYCPYSAERCHCTGCCDTRKIVVDDWPMYNFASGVHHQQEQPIDFPVGKSVFFKFSEVLKMNKCEGVAEMMEQLTVNAAVAHDGPSLSKEANNDLLANIKKDLETVGLTNMMHAFTVALHSKFICNKCKKQLELNDICYCDDAKTKCHCNSRTCCTVTVKERGKFT